MSRELVLFLSSLKLLRILDIVSVPSNSVSVDKKSQKEIKMLSQNNFVVGKFFILIIIKSSNSLNLLQT